MSAFLVSDRHIRCMVMYARHHDLGYPNWKGEYVEVQGNEQTTCSMLKRANVESLIARYGDSLGEDETDTSIEWAGSVPVLSDGDMANACRCFDYQANEVDSYHLSTAFMFTAAIYKHIACAVPETGEVATWCIEESA